MFEICCDTKISELFCFSINKNKVFQVLGFLHEYVINYVNAKNLLDKFL